MKIRLITALILSTCLTVQAQDDGYLELSLDQLLDIEVVSGTKASKSLKDSPSAVFVLTSEDIRRSGARTLPDLLRLTPGFTVQQTESSEYALSIRGVSSAQANKMLILVDGRSIYNTVFGATLWETQDLLFADIDRIEVIRGPGAASWGANAVNGVVNIITKSAAETEGTYVEVGGGNFLQAFGGIRAGSEVGEGHLRLSGKFEQRGAFDQTTGETADDGWKRGHASFRYDLETEGGDKVELHGGLNASRLYRDSTYYRLDIQEPLNFRERVDVDDQYLHFKHNSKASEDSEWITQAFLWRVSRDSEGGVGDLHRFDINVQNQRKLSLFSGSDGSFVWGGNYRIDWDKFEPAINTPTPTQEELHLIDGFFELNQTVAEDFDISLAVRAGHYYYTGAIVQPSARLLYRLTDKSTLWTAFSMASRNPSTFDERSRTGDIGYVVIPTDNSPRTAFTATGNPDLDPEELTAYEAGYRQEIFDGSGYLEITAFYNEYDDVIAPTATSVNLIPGPPPLILADTLGINAGTVKTWGGEAVFRAELTEWFKTTLSYSNIKNKINLIDGAIPTFGFEDDGFIEHIGSAWLNFDISESTKLDIYYRYAGAIGGDEPVDPYSEIDLSLIFALSDSAEVRLVGRNLLQSGHVEKRPNVSNGVGREVPRSAYANLVFRF